MSNNIIQTKTKMNLSIVPPQKKAFSIPTEEDFPKLHSISIFNGRRGSGKSCAVANLIKIGKQKGYFDKVWLISPTYYSNKEIWDMCGISDNEDEEDTETDILEPCITVLKEIMCRVDAERLLWEEHLAKLKKRS